jgi:hypothetical protein
LADRRQGEPLQLSNVDPSNFAARSRRRGDNAAAGAPCGDVVSSLALEPVLGAGDFPLLLNSAMSIGERALVQRADRSESTRKPVALLDAGLDRVS